MKPDALPLESAPSGRIPPTAAHSVNIETPGYHGSASVNPPPGWAGPATWANPETTRQWVLDNVVQVMGAVLASDLRDPLALDALPDLPRAFEELEFKSALNPAQPMRIVVRVQSRYQALCRGVFVAYQNTAFIAAGKLLLGQQNPQ